MLLKNIIILILTLQKSMLLRYIKLKILVWEARRRRRISLKELSQKSGISKSAINDIENNKVSPRVNTLEKIADALGMDISELMRKEN